VPNRTLVYWAPYTHWKGGNLEVGDEAEVIARPTVVDGFALDELVVSDREGIRSPKVPRLNT
jgi:hypothetical protein